MFFTLDSGGNSQRWKNLQRKIRSYSTAVLDSSLGLVVSLSSLVLIEFRYGYEGLGVFSYLLAMFFFLGYLADFGVSNYVERSIALLGRKRKEQAEVLADGIQAIVLTGVLAGLVISLFAYFGTDVTQIHEKTLGYLFIAIAIPFYNYNNLRISAMHAYGSHETAFRLRLLKRIFYLGAIVLLILFKVSPSNLTICFLLPEIIVLLFVKVPVKMPSLIKSNHHRW